MARPTVSDELWARIEPIVPKRAPALRGGGRPWIDDRACLVGILFVLRTGIAWRDVPGEIGASGVTCWRRLRDWHAAGVWDRLLVELLAELNAQGRLDLSLAVADSSTVRALRGGRTPGPTRRTGAKPVRSTTR